MRKSFLFREKISPGLVITNDSKPCMMEDGLPVSGKSKWKCPLNRGVQLQYARGWIECVECHIPRVYYAQKKLSEPERQQLIKIDDENRFMCGAQLGIKTENNIIFTDQRLTCGQKVENRLYKLIPGDSACIPCHKCGVWISDESAEKFHQLENEFNTILPCCDCSKCSKGPNQGWKTTAKKKVKNGGARKRPRAPPSDCDFTIPPLRVDSWRSCQEWLAESRHAWRQQRQKRSQKKQ